MDVLFVCISGDPSTVGIVGPDAIRSLGPTGLLVNVSRGAAVDEKALLEALETKTIAGAELDVFVNEPDIDPCFLMLNNVLPQPHHSSGTVEARTRMGALQRENLTAFFQANPSSLRCLSVYSIASIRSWRSKHPMDNRFRGFDRHHFLREG